jgi:hypothetical protein
MTLPQPALSGFPDAPAVLGARARVPDHVVYRSFVRETVVLNLQTGRYHGINPTGGRILDLLGADETLGAAAELLAAEYNRPLVDLERDVCQFCWELHDRGLIEVSTNGRH